MLVVFADSALLRVVMCDTVYMVDAEESYDYVYTGAEDRPA